MIDFILAGVFYLCLMFIVFFCVSFITVGLCYSAMVFFRQCVRWVNQPHPA
jgi:hypothetical protein